MIVAGGHEQGNAPLGILAIQRGKPTLAHTAEAGAGRSVRELRATGLKGEPHAIAVDSNLRGCVDPYNKASVRHSHSPRSSNRGLSCDRIALVKSLKLSNILDTHP